jgi:hypothetical protein
LARQLEELEAEERLVSLQRRPLQDRMALLPETATEYQRTQESELSIRRRSYTPRSISCVDASASNEQPPLRVDGITQRE